MTELNLQPTINIGMLGHVAHGKSTIVKAITNKRTQQHSKELKERGISIKLGYANGAFYQCFDSGCASNPNTEFTSLDIPGWFKENKGSLIPMEIPCKLCGNVRKLVSHVSFVDSPGHEYFMATMLSGACVMDIGILVVAANEKIPQPQTQEHLITAEIIGLNNIIVVQNKVDLLSKEEIESTREQIKDFLKGTIAENAPIIPVSAQHKLNIGVLLKQIHRYSQQFLKTSQKDLETVPRAIIIRSFDLNKPGSTVDNLVGGVAGGALVQGSLEVGQKIEIHPGIPCGDNPQCVPLRAEIQTIYSEKTSLNSATPGGLFAFGLDIDPTLTAKDRLVGQIIGLQGTFPEPIRKFEMKYRLLNRVDKTCADISIKKDDYLRLIIFSKTIIGRVVKRGKRKLLIELTHGMCVEDKQKVAMLKNISGKWRLIGCGIIINSDCASGTFCANSSNSDSLSGSDSDLSSSGSDFSFSQARDLLNHQMDDIKKKKSPKKARLSLPKMIKIGGKKCGVTNFGVYSEQLNRDIQHIKKYFETELSTTTSLSAEHALIINGIFRERQIQTILTKYLKEYVQCRACKHLESKIENNNFYCNFCGYSEILK